MKILEQYRKLCKDVDIAFDNKNAALAEITTAYDTVCDFKDFGRIESCINRYVIVRVSWFLNGCAKVSREEIEKCCDEYEPKRLCQCGNCKYAEKNWNAVAAVLAYDDAVRARCEYFRNLLPWHKKPKGK